MSKGTQISLQEVSRHSTPGDAWLAINGTVYDVTGFMTTHPGGEKVIQDHFGKDASQVYNDVHSPRLAANYFGKEKEMGRLEGYGDISSAPSRNEKPLKNPKLISEPPALTGLINVRDFEDAARVSLNERSWAYISGFTDDGQTFSKNSKIYQDLFLRPRVLNAVDEVDLSTTIGGHRFDIPVFNSPASLSMVAHPCAEVAIAKALSDAGSTIIAPTMASYSLDEIVEALPEKHPFFFQLYVHHDHAALERTLNDLRRLKPAGIMVTVDLPVMSKREANERYEIKSKQAAFGGTRPDALPKKKKNKDGAANQSRAASNAIRSDLTWEFIIELKERTGIPVYIKGVQSAEDALKALNCGCAGIYISNHGGRAVDTSQPSLLTLAEIRLRYPHVLEKLEVFIDGGIRRGTDVLKAICLGAKGVCMGRPFFYSLIYGQEGVEHLMDRKAMISIRYFGGYAH